MGKWKRLRNFFENFIKLKKVYIVNFIFVIINKSKKVFFKNACISFGNGLYFN